MSHSVRQSKPTRPKVSVYVSTYVRGPSPGGTTFTRRKRHREPTFPEPLASALTRAFMMLRPDILWKKPLMFMIAVATALLVAYTVVKAIDRASSQATLGALIALDVGLFLVIPFAYFAQPLLDARGKASPRPARKTARGTPAFRLLTGPGSEVESLIAAYATGDVLPVERVTSSDLKDGDVIVAVAGEIIPVDGNVIAGVASVDGLAITGEATPVICEARGEHSRVTAGTLVLSNCIVVRALIGRQRRLSPLSHAPNSVPSGTPFLLTPDSFPRKRSWRFFS